MPSRSFRDGRRRHRPANPTVSGRESVEFSGATTGAGAGKVKFQEFDARPGPRISAATVAHGKLHVTLTFHKSGTFLAYIVSHPAADPFNGNGRVTYTTVSLGHHSAGPEMVSLTLGKLTNGRDGIIIVPTIDPKTTAKAKQGQLGLPDRRPPTSRRSEATPAVAPLRRTPPGRCRAGAGPSSGDLCCRALLHQGQGQAARDPEGPTRATPPSTD